MAQNTTGNRILLLVQAAIGLTWLRAGVGKLTDGQFVSGMDGTLGAFAGHNPHGWFRDFLLSTAIPHAAVFGRLVEYGETAVGLGLAATAMIGLRAMSTRVGAAWSAVTLGALGGGVLMSTTYWLATAWMAPADDTVNLLMAVIQAALAIAAAAPIAATIRGHRHHAVAGPSAAAAAA